MKKFYLLAASILVAGAANADSLSFTFGETPIENGATFEYTDALIDEYPDGIAVGWYPDLNLVSDYPTGPLTVVATCTTGHEIAICVGGSCEAGESVTKHIDGIGAGTSLPLIFDYSTEVSSLDELSTVSTIITASDDTNAESEISMTVEFSCETNAIKSIEFNKNVVVGNGNIAYSLNAPATLEVYSASGVRVLNTNVSGNGTTNISNLAPGLYIYRLGSETGKFIAR